MLTRKPLFIILVVLLSLAIPSGFAVSQEETQPVESTEIQSTDLPAGEETEEAVAPEDEQAPAAPQPGEEETDQNQPAKKKAASAKTKESVQLLSEGGEGGDGGGESSGSNASPVPDAYVYTGAAGYKVPIKVPPGRNGLAPSIALTYNSYRGNSWVGTGWDLDLGSIRRSTKHGLNYTANDYVSESTGSSVELVPQPSWGTNYYEAKIEEEFSKYYYNTGTYGWEVTAKDGTKYYYGSIPGSRQGKDANNIFKWCLDKIEDTNDNYMEITYTNDQGELYPNEIKYTGHNPGLLPANSIKFILEDRTDVRTSFTTETQIVTAKRLKTIEVYANNQFVRKYVINNTYSPNTNRTLINSITQYGSDGATPLPATSFQYQNGGDPGTFNDPIIQNGGGSLLSGMADVNGDGLADMVSYSAVNKMRPSGNDELHFQYRLNLGNGQFDSQVSKTIILSNSSSPYSSTPNPFYGECSGGPGCMTNEKPEYDLRTIVGDIDGDGKLDVVIGGMLDYNSHRTAVCLGLGNGDFSPPLIIDGGGSVLSNIIDINGDGLGDMVSYSAVNKMRPSGNDTLSFQYRLSLGNSQFGFLVSKTITLSDSSSPYSSTPNPFYGECSGGPGCLTNEKPEYDLRTIVGDINGDGKLDVVIGGMLDYNSHRTAICLGLGNGDFSPPLIIDGGGSVLSDIVDINGDGLGDMVSYSAENKKESFESDKFSFSYRLSLGNGQFGPSVNKTVNFGNIFAYKAQAKEECYEVEGPSGSVHTVCHIIETDEIDPAYALRTLMGDINGDGKWDFIVGGMLDYNSPRSVILLTSGSAPDLLTTVTNGYGGSAGLQYTPSTQYTNTALPFVLQTVSGVTTNDGLGNQAVTNYTYSGGDYDFSEREFSGFANSGRTNPDGTQEITQFHQDYYRKGRPHLTQLLAPAGSGGALLSQTTLAWDIAALSSGVTFVKLSQKRAESYDDQTVFSQTDYTYDEQNGNLLTTVTQGTDGENITKFNEYQNYGDWIWRQCQETITGSTSGQVRKTYCAYENNTGNLLYKSFWLQGGIGINPAIKMTYDDYGNVISVVDAWGNTSGNLSAHTTFTDYDTTTHTYPIKVTAPPTTSGTHITETGWNELYSRPAWSKDENGNMTSFTYDLFARLIQIDFPDGGQKQYQYFDNAFPRYVASWIKEDGSHFIPANDFYDGFGRLIQTVALGESNKVIIKKTHYDNMGRVYLIEGPFFAASTAYPQQPPTSGYPWTMTIYDHRGRPVQIEQPYGDYPEPVGLYYSYSGFSTTITDSDVSRKTEKKDYLGRIKEVVEYNDPEEYHTTYQYNAAGDLLNVTNALGHQTIITYDTLGRKTAMQDPDMGSWTYTYDPNGNLLTQTDAKSQIITFTYDALNRVLTKSTGTAYVYDNTTIPNGKGRVYSVTKGTTVNINNAYDTLGRVTSTTKTIAGSNYTTLTAYDLSGKVTQIAYPDGHSVTNTYYPGTGLIQSVSSGTTIYGLFTDYEPTGKIGQVDHANGTATKYTYDPWSTKLFGIVTQDPSGQPANDLQNKTYHYTRAGDIDQIVDYKKEVTYAYTYDRLHRLKGETSSGPGAPTATEVVTLDYTYGNSAHVHAVSDITLNGTAHSFNYDLNGNLTQGPDLTNPNQVATRTITYDQDNMPIQIVHPQATVDFTYDGLGTRVKKAVQGGSTTYYIGAHYEVKDGVITKYIFGGNLRLAVIKGTSTYYYHKDHLGSTGAITDSAGNKVEGTEYLPFGSMREHTGSNVSDYKFTDQELDNETGLYNYDARLYDPVLGMFVTPDSIVPGMYDPQALNRYSYCRNNPLIYVDPSGHDHNWDGCRSLPDPNDGIDRNTEDGQEQAKFRELGIRQNHINIENTIKESLDQGLIDYKKTIKNPFKRTMVNNLVYSYGKKPVSQIKEMMENYNKWDAIADFLGLMHGRVTNLAALAQTLWEVNKQWKQAGSSSIVGIEGEAAAFGGCGGSIGIAVNTGSGESVIDFATFGSLQSSVGYSITAAAFFGRALGDVTNLTGLTVNVSFGYGFVGGTFAFDIKTGNLVSYQIDVGWVGVTATGSIQATGAISARQVLSGIFGLFK